MTECTASTPPHDSLRTRTGDGFTFIEMSMVLMIIGLLVGGVVAGKYLIEVAQNQRIIGEIDSFKSALSTFRIKYNGLPGDITNATIFWGADDSCPNTPTNTVKKQATCNGNGNGFIRGSAGCVHGEFFRSWQQLSNAGLVNGPFTGVSNTAACGAEAVLGLNVPVSALGTGGYTLAAGAETPICYNGDTAEFDGCVGNALYLGGQRVGITYSPLLTPGTALAIDAKLDDGKPAFGWIRAPKMGYSVIPNCTTSNSSSTAEYNLLGSNLCSIYIMLE